MTRAQCTRSIPLTDAVAKTERYRARRSYSHDEVGVNVRLLSSDAGSAYVAIKTTPHGGRAATLRIRRADALVERITLAPSPRKEELRFSDFRRVGNVVLPLCRRSSTSSALRAVGDGGSISRRRG